MTNTFLVVCLFLAACFPAVAQRGGGGHGGGGTAAKSFGFGQRRSSAPIQRRPAYSSPAVPAPTQQRFSGGNANNRIGTRGAVNNYYGGGWRGCWGRNHFFGQSIWWGGGWYGPCCSYWFNPGWYYPALIYPDTLYWNGWAGYRLNVIPSSKSGLRCELSPIGDTTTRQYAEKGVVEIASDDDNWARVGSVKRLSKKTYRLEPGTYGVKIIFPGNRELEMTVEVREGNVTYAPITFSQPAATQPQQQQLPQQAPPEQPLVPAPAPDEGK